MEQAPQHVPTYYCLMA